MINHTKLYCDYRAAPFIYFKLTFDIIIRFSIRNPFLFPHEPLFRKPWIGVLDKQCINVSGHMLIHGYSDNINIRFQNDRLFPLSFHKWAWWTLEFVYIGDQTLISKEQRKSYFPPTHACSVDAVNALIGVITCNVKGAIQKTLRLCSRTHSSGLTL